MSGTWITDPLTWAVISGCMLGASVWLLAMAVHPPRPDLVALAGRWQARPQRYPPTDAGTSRRGPRLRAGRGLGFWLEREATRRGLRFDRLRADLALLDRSLEQHLVTKVALAGCGLLLTVATSSVLRAAGLGVPGLGSLALAVVLAGACFVLPDLAVAGRAQDRRADLRRALACYLDLVSMSLSGGRGVPEALPTAAQIGQGWGFELIAHTLATARSSGITPWAALGELGERTGIAELQDLGSALTLVAHDGAKIRQSLTARASTQRRRQLAEAEGDAKRRAQSMTAAQVVLALGFLVFLGYPALINVLAV